MSLFMSLFMSLVKGLLPKKLAGQLILLLLSTLVFSQLFTLFFFLSESDYIVEQIEKKQLLRRSAQAVNILSTVPKKHHKATIKAMSVHRVKFSFSNQVDKTLLSQAAHFSDDAKFLTGLLNMNGLNMNELNKKELNQSKNKVLVYQYEQPHSRFFSLIEYLFGQVIGGNDSKKINKRKKLFSTAVEIEQGVWFNMDVYSRDPFPLWAKSTLFSLLFMSLIFIIIVVLSVNRITRPLHELAAKAKQLGMGENINPITEQGPEDIQHAIKAFNKMQSRLNNMIVHRARSLAAMSHDLRTPLTSLRLHAEFISDEATQEKIIEKLDEMEQITKATISFAKQDSWLEKPRLVDLTALIESLCLDLSDIGLQVTYQLIDNIKYTCRPVALKRALSNLIENGVKYGNAVDVSIVEGKKRIEILISDQGEGIPETEQKRMFQAFERLDDSRNKDSGGMGLGMTIALTAIQDHGGEIILVNKKRDGQRMGLLVRVILPK